MARSRYLFFEKLRRMGTSLFNFFSCCEGRGVMPGAARWMKASFLSAFVASLGALSAASFLNCGCYLPIQTEPTVEWTTVTPNPTAGNDSVTVESYAHIPVPPRDEEYYIEKAICILENDTTQMRIRKDAFEGRDELKVNIYVGGLISDETYTVRVEATNNKGEMGYEEEDLVVSE